MDAHSSVARFLPVIRLLGALGGLLGGAFAGILILILAMILTGSTFELANIFPGAIFGAAIGAVIGFLSPKAGRKLFELLSSAG
jgi:uncharacterized membrane protein SpoIIM required for sporulation